MSWWRPFSFFRPTRACECWALREAVCCSWAFLPVSRCHFSSPAFLLCALYAQETDQTTSRSVHSGDDAKNSGGNYGPLNFYFLALGLSLLQSRGQQLTNASPGEEEEAAPHQAEGCRNPGKFRTQGLKATSDRIPQLPSSRNAYEPQELSSFASSGLASSRRRARLCFGHRHCHPCAARESRVSLIAIKVGKTQQQKHARSHKLCVRPSPTSFYP